MYSNDRTAIFNVNTATSRDVLLSSASKHVDLFLERLFDLVLLVVQGDGDRADLLIGQRVERLVLHHLLDVFDGDLFLGQHLEDFFGELFVSDLLYELNGFFYFRRQRGRRRGEGRRRRRRRNRCRRGQGCCRTRSSGR